jgi:hypothetical protein
MPILGNGTVKDLMPGSTMDTLSTTTTPKEAANYVTRSGDNRTARDTNASTAKSGEKLIFLDIDGVICCNGVQRLEEDKLTQLQRMVRATGAHVVLSTDWRKFETMKRELLGVLGDLDIESVGDTPDLKQSKSRPLEIRQWLQENASEPSYHDEIPTNGSRRGSRRFSSSRLLGNRRFSGRRSSWHDNRNKYRKNGRIPIQEWVAIDDRNLLEENGGTILQGRFVLTGIIYLFICVSVSTMRSPHTMMRFSLIHHM